MGNLAQEGVTAYDRKGAGAAQPSKYMLLSGILLSEVGAVRPHSLSTVLHWEIEGTAQQRRYVKVCLTAYVID